MERELLQYLTKNNHQKGLHIEGEPSDWHITKLAQGEYNINYLLTSGEQKLVLRLNTASQMHLTNQIEYEFTALKHLIPSGVTPVPLYYDDCKTELPLGFLVMEYLEGRSLIYEKDLFPAAKTLAKIHSMKMDFSHLVEPVDPKRAMLEECRMMLAKYKSSPRAERAKVERLQRLLAIGERLGDAEQTVRCCINTELNSGNFIVSPSGECFLVDWEKPLYADPAQDLGHFLAPTTTLWKTESILSPKSIEDFVQEYVSQTAGRLDTRGIYERTLKYIQLNCLRGLTWCAMAWVEYQDPNKKIQNEDTKKKLDFYLSDEFLDRIEEEYVRGSLCD